jgi:hypothetical protein
MNCHNLSCQNESDETDGYINFAADNLITDKQKETEKKQAEETQRRKKKKRRRRRNGKNKVYYYFSIGRKHFHQQYSHFGFWCASAVPKRARPLTLSFSNG